MKQIFDRMRESIRLNSYDCCESNYSVDMVVDENVAIRIVDEAEAKWEADCCEWKRGRTFQWVINSPHKGLGVLQEQLDLYKFCPYCGKPIKISEVE